MFCRYDALRDLGSGKFSTIWLAGESRARQGKANALYRNADVALTCDALQAIARMRSPGIDKWSINLSMPLPRPKLAFVRMSVFLKGLVVIHRFQAILLFDNCQALFEQMFRVTLREDPYAKGVHRIVELDGDYVPPKKRPRKVMAANTSDSLERIDEDAHLMVEPYNQIAPLEEGFGPSEFTEAQLNTTIEEVIMRASPGRLQDATDTSYLKRSMPHVGDESSPQEKIARIEQQAREQPENIPVMEYSVHELPREPSIVGAGNDSLQQPLGEMAGNENATISDVISSSISLQSQKPKKRAVRRRRPKVEERIYVNNIYVLRSYTSPEFCTKLQRAKSWMGEVIKERIRPSSKKLAKQPILEMVDAQPNERPRIYLRPRSSYGMKGVMREKSISKLSDWTFERSHLESAVSHVEMRDEEQAVSNVSAPVDLGPEISGIALSDVSYQPGLVIEEPEAPRPSKPGGSFSESGGTPAKRRRLDLGEETIPVVSHGRIWDGSLLRERLAGLWATQDGPVSFYEICPPGKASRKDAAKVMSTLLDLQKKMQLNLKQDSPSTLTPILIYPPSF